MQKYIYSFGKGEAEGNSEMRELLGSKGANLAEMSRIGLPIPPGFTITSDVCNLYYKNQLTIPNPVIQMILHAMKSLEFKMSLEFGNCDIPLLVSVRSGAASSMPGMLDTVLNVGINDKIACSIAKTNKRFAYDSYRRLIQMYGTVVLKITSCHFEETLQIYKENHNIKNDQDLTGENLSEICNLFKKIIFEYSKQDFPQDVYVQLLASVNAVFDSWNNERAIIYRKINNFSSEVGTAVTIQMMVFGNADNSSASGVAFTRNPSNGEKEIFGEYMVNTQGEDVVSGCRTPKSLIHMKDEMPQIYEQFVKIANILESHYADMQDIEFTIQSNQLWILQTRSGKRTVMADIRIAVDMVSESLISKNDAILKIKPKLIEQLLHPTVIITDDTKPIGEGLAASPGAATGLIAFSNEEAIVMSKKIGDVILVRNETSPEDIAGMNVAKGIITTKGGVTSHAAVVARGMGKPCICGTNNIHIDMENKYFIDKHGNKFFEGDTITIDGSSGLIFANKVKTTLVQFSEHIKIFFSWVDNIRTIKVRANADSEKDAKNAIEFGSDGIGLCRTEHMFFAKDRIFLVRKMILSETYEERIEPLSQLLLIQKEDFKKIFDTMNGLPVTIRLLDPPLHEFLPNNEKSINDFVNDSGWSEESVIKRINALKEVNPMLGNRGSRLAISFPEIYQMQLKAIFSAAEDIKGVNLEIMLPFIMNDIEFLILKNLVKEVAKNYNVQYLLGNMIELPCAVISSGKIAQHSDFFSIGTNDLTQTVLGISRDDSSKFLDRYQKDGIFKTDPFTSIDVDTVGEMINLSMKLGKESNKQIKIGICGEHGGDPDSIAFFAKIGIDYVSCSPYRVPIAKLALAQFALKKS